MNIFLNILSRQPITIRMEDSFIAYECSTHLGDENYKHSTEYMVFICMMMYLSPKEFDRWFRTRDIQQERRRICVICRNKCQVCILKNVGLPLFLYDEDN